MILGPDDLKRDIRETLQISEIPLPIFHRKSFVHTDTQNIIVDKMIKTYYTDVLVFDLESVLTKI